MSHNDRNELVGPKSDDNEVTDSIIEEVFSEYGYPNRKLSDRISVFINRDVTIIKWLTKNNVSFLIVFQISSNKIYNFEDLDIFLGPEDQYCSSFIIRNNGLNSFYKKNFSTKSIEQSNDILLYRMPKNLKPNYPSNFLSDRFESFFFEAHSLIRDIDGLHPDEALDELCKIIYTKLYDEEIVKELKFCFFDLSVYGNYEEYAATLRKLYSEANEYDIRVFSLKIPGYKRSRGVFDDPIKLSSLALSKVSELFSQFSFSKSDIDIKARAFQNVYRPTTRAGMGQYFTPLNVIRFIISVVKPSCNELILDPFCGSAHFLTESINFTRNSTQSDKLKNEFLFNKLHGIEKSERMVRIAMTDMRLHGDGHSNIRCTDALLSFNNYYDITPNTFDIIMTNPPFGSTLTNEMTQYVGDFDLIKRNAKIPLEVLGLERCIQLLREGGKLAIVLPESILVNKTYKYVREWIKTNTKIRAIVSLPIETFMPYGANIKTSIVFCVKDKNAHQSTYNVFSGGIDNIGYDATGKVLQENDWENLSIKLCEFLEKEGW